MKWLRRYPEIITLTLLAFVTRLWGIFSPAAIVFDEVYFKVYAGDYLTGNYYFDPHPPLGKLILGAWAWISRQDPTIVTGDHAAVMLRIVPAIAGALIIPVFFIFLRQLGASKKVATLGTTLLLLDNALLVESRFILIDSLLLLFGLSAITMYLSARRSNGWQYWAKVSASLALAGATASTKWTGISALGLIGVIWGVDIIRRRRHLQIRRTLITGALMCTLPVLIYLATFWLHFQLLPNSGQGDAFMSQRFQQTLKGNPNYDPSVKLTFWEKFGDLNRAMRDSEESLKTATHPYGSKWYSWPLMIRPIYYWQGETAANGTQGNIYLLGNPVVWWGIPVVLLSVGLLTTKAAARLRRYRWQIGLLVVAYIANFLPFSQIVRVMFLYHYFFALMYSLALAVILLGIMADWNRDGEHPWHFSSAISKWIYIATLTLALIGFIYIAPLSYGIPLNPVELTHHMWLNTWR